MAKSLKDNLPDTATKEDRKYVEEHGDHLSDSTQYAQWISSPDEHEERSGRSLVTRNHDVIRKWAEERGAAPATVPGTEHGDRIGVLRFIFTGGDQDGSDRLQEVSWEEWFKTFDERNLVMIFQEHLKNGNQSNFFRFDNPEREDA
jgi:hypothetical protein